VSHRLRILYGSQRPQTLHSRSLLASRDARFMHALPKTLEGQFAEIAQNQPELLARHYTEAGLIEKAAAPWGKAGQRSLARSALAEAAKQLPRALAQIAALPPTPALRREEIKLQVAFINSLMHVKGYVPRWKPRQPWKRRVC
jgi:hypothetical protein